MTWEQGVYKKQEEMPEEFLGKIFTCKILKAIAYL
jgi:hypothetical protein